MIPAFLFKGCVIVVVKAAHVVFHFSPETNVYHGTSKQVVLYYSCRHLWWGWTIATKKETLQQSNNTNPATLFNTSTIHFIPDILPYLHAYQDYTFPQKNLDAAYCKPNDSFLHGKPISPRKFFSIRVKVFPRAVLTPRGSALQPRAKRGL